MKKTIICVITILVLCIGLANATSFTTKIELELTGLTGISQIDNSDGTSVDITIHSAASGAVVESRDAAAGIYASGMVIPMAGNKFTLSYATDYTYNLSTIYGEFLYNFTTPAEPAAGGEELHTGQTTLYRAGDDADVDGTGKSYTDHGDGTVTDNHAGLMWVKADGGTTTRTWNDAIDYCNGLSTADYTDWHLPTAVEGIIMWDYSCGGSAPAHCYAKFQNSALLWSTSTSYYWTSTTRPDYTPNAYNLFAGVGYLSNDPKTDSYYVRCVRSI